MDFMLPAVACNALFYSITCFSTYISSTQNIFKFIVEHKDSDYAIFQHQLESTDLTNKLNITSALIKDIVNTLCNYELTNKKDPFICKEIQGLELIEIEIVNTMNFDKISEPIKIAMLSTLDVANKIIVLIETIHKKIQVHQLSYMKSFIKINIGTEIKNIMSLTQLFNMRLDMLVNLLKIYNIFQYNSVKMG
jgi:hypothetical protein